MSSSNEVKVTKSNHSLNELVLFFLRHGDPNRALLYLNKAVSCEQEDEILFILRSNCHMKLGHYDSADQVSLQPLQRLSLLESSS